MKLNEYTATGALVVIGKMLHGLKWQRKLADDLNINERQIRRWVKAETLLTSDSPVFDDLLRLMEKRIELMHDLYGVLYPWRTQALAEAHLYDTAFRLIAMDGSIPTLSFQRFRNLMKHNAASASKLGVTKEGYELALQGAWEKVHI